MERMKHPWLIIIAALLSTTMGYICSSSTTMSTDTSETPPTPNPQLKPGDVFAKLIPPTPFFFTLPTPPDPTPNPQLNPAGVPNCPKLEMRHKGFNATQEEGDISLPQEKHPPTKPIGSQSAGISSHNFTMTIKNRTTTTTTMTKIEITTTTTVNETTTRVNTTMQMKPPTGKIGAQYNWWQILLDNGGKPGTLKGKLGPENQTFIPVSNPCNRPMEVTLNSQYAYTYLDSDLKTFYRQEIAYPRFQGTSNYFADIRGYLVWKPPKILNDTHIYAVRYIVDDTGFWVHVNLLI